ncbi:MAG: hypothetical protein ACI4TP_06615 [Anaerotignum sp.]
MPFKFSITIGLIFFLIAVFYLVEREEPFTIFESAVRFWPMTLFGIIYAVINTFTFQGFMYNQASIVAPIENISNGTSVMLLVLAYVALGKADSVWEFSLSIKLPGFFSFYLG